MAAGRSARSGQGSGSPRASRTRRLLRRLLAAAPDVGIAIAFVTVAADAAARDGAAGTALWRAALMEFWAIHAGGLLMLPWILGTADRARRALMVAGIAGAYSLVLGIASLVAGVWWPIATFWALTGNRALDITMRDPPDGAAVFEEFYPWIGGVTLFAAIASITGMIGPERSTVLVAGAIYFAANAVSSLGDWWWVRRWLRRSERRGWLP